MSDPATLALVGAEHAMIPVVEVLKLIERTRAMTGNIDWRQACDCVEDLILNRAARDANLGEVDP